jgi:hypothetical protein
MEGILKYGDYEKPQKIQIFNFIRKVYPNATPRDIISGLHSVICKNGMLVSVSTDLSMVAKYSKK